MSLLRTTRVAALVFVLAPAVAQAAPAASRKPPPTPAVSRDPRPDATKTSEAAKPAAKAAAAGVKNANARGATARIAPAPGPQRTPPSRSIGSPTEGQLVGGVHLGDAPYLRIYPVYSGTDVRWGTDTLVGLVDRAAKSVRKQFPDAVLSVGHLSKNGGGELDRHASHESGRDADLGFYVKNLAGRPVYSDHMVPFNGNGTAPTWPGAQFDDARNWALVAAIVSDPRAKVTHLFVATPIRERLLAYAAKIGAPPAVRSRASEVLAQPRGSLPHDDHFHVRIACPPGAEKCIELPMARRRPAGHGGAVASQARPAQPARGTSSGVASRAPAGTPAPAPAGGAANPASAPPPPAKPAVKPVEPPKEESARSESLIPSLSPAIPGLDSAVIPSPLTGVRSTWGIAKDPPPAPKADPVSDPDGVLERN